jgi:hypothetical protein
MMRPTMRLKKRRKGKKTVGRKEKRILEYKKSPHGRQKMAKVKKKSNLRP